METNSITWSWGVPESRDALPGVPDHKDDGILGVFTGDIPPGG